MNTKRENMKIKLLVVLSLTGLVTGCGLTYHQKQQVSQFATATESVSSSTQEQFKATRDKVLEIEKRRLIMRNIAPPKNLDLDGGLSVSGITTLITTLKALGSYGDLLNKLASNDQSDAIKKAATEFLTQYEAANKLQDDNYSLPEDKKNSFSSIISMTGSLYLEYEKKKHVKSIVNTYTPEISKLANLLTNDLTLKEDSICIPKEKRKDTTTIKTGVIDHYCTSAKSLKQVSSSILKNSGHSFTEREFAYESYVLSLGAIEEVNLMSKKGAKAVAGLIKANNKLTEVIIRDKYTADDIKAYAQQVNDLKTLIKVLTKN